MSLIDGLVAQGLSGRASEPVIGRSWIRLLLGELGLSFPEYVFVTD